MRIIYTTVLSLLLVALLSVTCKRKEAAQPEEDPPPAVAVEVVLSEVQKMLSGNDSLSYFSRLISHGVFPANTDFSKGATFLAPINQPGGLPISKEDIASYVIAGKVDISQLTDGSVLTTVTGTKVEITVQSGNLFGNGVQLSPYGELKQGNYTVIPIDRQLPYTPKGFASRVCGDPNDGAYYLSYYANGKLVDWEGAYPTPWETITQSLFNFYSSGCEAVYSFGASRVAPSFRNSGWGGFVPAFSLSFSAISDQGLPKVGTYRISDNTYDPLADRNKGAVWLVMAGHHADPASSPDGMPISPYRNRYEFVCGKDSYIEASITEVKIENELPGTSHYIGYYKGTFHAVIYGPSRDERQKIVITDGRFMAPILPFNCSPDKPMRAASAEPPLNRFALLTSGRWSVRLLVEEAFRNPDPELPPARCQLDDYFVFRNDMSFALVDGGDKCEPGEGSATYVDTKGWGEKFQWKLLDDNAIQLPGEIWNIVRLTDRELAYTVTFPDYPGYQLPERILLKE